LVLLNFGSDLPLSPIPEPLLAPPRGHRWRVLWSSEAIAYGGGGVPALATDDTWSLPGESALVLAPEAAA
jgi:maltooligosyltrehalose trehalohydrolase